MPESDNHALIGRTIAGKYLVEAVISTGGAGTVYRARQVALDRVVALKVLRDEVAQEADFIARFRREARAASRLDHPNSVRVLDFGQDGDSLFYLAMEYVEGRTLHEMIREEWPFDDRRIVDLMAQVLSAVAVAHDMNVIHRDLKPDNIMIIRGRTDDGELREVAKVCDFGIASLGAAVGDAKSGGPEEPHVTLRGFLVGTPEFMSPEQARGAPADRRSDVYAAGLVLYEMLAQRLPFEGENPYAIVVKHVTEAPPPPSRFARVNPALEAICLKAISKEPRDRHADARAMRAALRAVFPSAVEAPEATPLPEDVLPSRGRRWLFVGVPVVAAAAAIALYATSRGRAEAPVQVTAEPVTTPHPYPLPARRGEGLLRGRIPSPSPSPSPSPLPRSRRCRHRLAPPWRRGGGRRRPGRSRSPWIRRWCLRRRRRSSRRHRPRPRQRRRCRRRWRRSTPIWRPCRSPP